jgi:hypothetical protein
MIDAIRGLARTPAQPATISGISRHSSPLFLTALRQRES